MEKTELYVVTEKSGMIQDDKVHKGDDQIQGAKMARRIARMIRRRPDVLDKHPEWEKHKDADEKMIEAAKETKERHREEAPGPTHENLEQEDDTAEKSTTQIFNDTRQGFAKVPPKKETREEYFVGGSKVAEAKGNSALLRGYGEDENATAPAGQADGIKEVEEFDDSGKKTRDEKVHKSTEEDQPFERSVRLPDGTSRLVWQSELSKSLRGDLLKGADGQVASVAVIHDDHILMGKRRDNQRWTLPGGHLDPGEDAHEGGKRELKEEAGIEADKLEHLKTEKIKTHSGKEKTIHAFKFVVSKRPKTSMVADPDQEVYRWQWIKYKDGLPKRIKNHLHSPKNLVLDTLAIKSKAYMGDEEKQTQADPVSYYVKDGASNHGTGGSLAMIRDEAKKKGKDFAHGGIVDKKDLFIKEKKVEDKEYTEKSLFFVRDLIKARSHKYLRKYKGRDGEWVYIYHEGDQHHKLSEEDVAAHKHLALHGEEDERHHHSELIQNMQTMGDEDIEAHRLLAQHGDEAERKHHTAILEAIGHKKNKLERTVTQAQRRDPSDEELAPEKRAEALGALKKEIDEMFTYLGGHSTTPVGQAILGMDKASLLEMASKPKTIRGILSAMNGIANKVEEAQGARTSSNHSVTSNGGTYGNMIYNKTMKALVDKNIIPQEYADEHKREARTPMIPKNMAGIAERAEQRRRAQEEEEHRSLGELHDSMAFHMASIMSGSHDRVQKAREIDDAIKRIFGKSLKKSEWPYNFDSEGLKVKIKNAEISSSGMTLDMEVYDADGNQIMQDWTRNWSNKEGRPHIYNAYMAVKPQYRGSAKVGDLINRGQRDLMRRQPRGGVVAVTAALDVGGYNWANQGFSFSSQSELATMRDRFATFCAEKGVNLTNEDLRNFTEPVHIAAFTDGKKYIKEVHPYKLSPSQIESRSLTGVSGEHRLTMDEISEGKSRRMAVHLGKAFLLNRSWHGVWDSAEQNATTTYADNYRQLRERAVKHLERGYKAVAEAAQRGERSREVPRPATVTPRSSLPNAGGGIADRQIRVWSPRVNGTERTNIRMTATRMNRVMRWSPEQIQHFMRNASITPAARRELNRRIAAQGATS